MIFFIDGDSTLRSLEIRTKPITQPVPLGPTVSVLASSLTPQGTKGQALQCYVIHRPYDLLYFVLSNHSDAKK